MKLLTTGVLWVLLYLALALSPLVLVLLGDPPPARGFWTELSVALGFVGLAVLGLQFALSARSSGVDAPYGLDVVLQFHRYMGLVGVALVLAHPTMLFLSGAAPWTLLNVVEAGWLTRFGLISIVGLLVLVATSVWRQRLRLRYEVWRLLHDVLAAVVVLAALVHVEMVGYYVQGLWRQLLWAGLSLAVVGLLAWVRVVKPLLLRRRPWVVTDVSEPVPDVWTLRLHPRGHEGIRFQPGQFVWLTIGRSPLRITEHPFSISSSAQRGPEVELTIKAAGDFTSGIGRIATGTVAYLDGPYGVFTNERNEGPAFLFVAGGIGITPIMSMLRTLADLEDARPMTLLYANPDPGSVAFAEELAELGGALRLEVVHVLEHRPPGWPAEEGLVTGELIERHLPAAPERTQCFVCGPPPMAEVTLSALDDLGVPPESVHNERFELV